MLRNRGDSSAVLILCIVAISVGVIGWAVPSPGNPVVQTRVNILSANIVMTSDLAAKSTGYGVTVTIQNDPRLLILVNFRVTANITGTWRFDMHRVDDGSGIPAKGAAVTGSKCQVTSFYMPVSSTVFNFGFSFVQPDPGLSICSTVVKGNTYSYYWEMQTAPAASQITIQGSGASALTSMIIEDI